MAYYNAGDLISKPLPGIDQGAAYFGSVTPSAVIAASDILRPMKLPGGFKLGALLVNVRVAFGAAAPASIGLTHTDGSVVPASVYGSATAATVIAAATDVTHATVGTKVVMPQIGTVSTFKDSYLEVLFGAPTTPAAGTADYCAFGEFLGTR